MQIALLSPNERVEILKWGKMSVYGGELVRNVCMNLYLSMEVATESEVAQPQPAWPQFLLFDPSNDIDHT